MNQNKSVKITPEVNMDERVFYLIRMDKEEMAFVDTEREALLVVDSIAAVESKRYKDDWTKVFRQDLDDGRKVIISTQSLGVVINGTVTKTCEIDFIPVGHATLTKGRLTLAESMILSKETTSPIPLPDALERLSKAKEDLEESLKTSDSEADEPNEE